MLKIIWGRIIAFVPFDLILFYLVCQSKLKGLVSAPFWYQ